MPTSTKSAAPRMLGMASGSSIRLGRPLGSDYPRRPAECVNLRIRIDSGAFPSILGLAEERFRNCPTCARILGSGGSQKVIHVVVCQKCVYDSVHSYLNCGFRWKRPSRRGARKTAGTSGKLKWVRSKTTLTYPGVRRESNMQHFRPGVAVVFLQRVWAGGRQRRAERHTRGFNH